MPTLAQQRLEGNAPGEGPESVARRLQAHVAAAVCVTAAVAHPHLHVLFQGMQGHAMHV